MLKPIIELINENVEATLRGISAAAGYTFTPAAVEWEAETNIPLDGKVIIFHNDPEPVEDGALGWEEWNVKYAIACYAARAGAQPTYKTKLNRMMADVCKAVMQDVNRGGYALNTTIGESESDDHGPAFRVAMQAFSVHFRHLRGQPHRQS